MRNEELFKAMNDNRATNYTHETTSAPICTIIENKALGIQGISMNSVEMLNKYFNDGWVVQELMEIESNSWSSQGHIVILQRLREEENNDTTE